MKTKYFILTLLSFLVPELYAQSGTTNLNLLENRYQRENDADNSIFRIYTFELPNTVLVLDSTHVVEHITAQIDSASHTLHVKVDRAGAFSVKLTEPLTNTIYTAYVDNLILAYILQNNDEQVIIRVEGGIPPYSISLQNENNTEFNFVNSQDSVISLSFKEMLEKGFEGKITAIEVQDRDGDVNNSITIPFQHEIKTPFNKNLIWIVVLFGAMVSYMIYKKISSKQKKQLASTLKKQHQQKLKESSSLTNENDKIESSKITIETKKNTNKNVSKSQKFIIRKKEDLHDGSKNDSEFEELITEKKYFEVNLNNWWKDSSVHKLYISPKFKRQLTEFLKQSNPKSGSIEKEGMLPEVGGFIMGYYNQYSDSEYRLSLEEFIPFVPEYNDVFKIEIGTQTLVHELGDAQDKFPDMAVIGWFHTHPGHGLFLSSSDLSVQKHFPAAYQLAMEIDSLTTALDTAFFTYNSYGYPNNFNVKNQGSKWLSWSKISQL